MKHFLIVLGIEVILLVIATVACLGVGDLITFFQLSCFTAVHGYLFICSNSIYKEYIYASFGNTSLSVVGSAVIKMDGGMDGPPPYSNYGNGFRTESAAAAYSKRVSTISLESIENNKFGYT